MELDTYKEALQMAVNTTAVNSAKVDYEKDTWEVVVFEDGSFWTITLRGDYIRACFKWLLKGGTNTIWTN